MNFAQKILLITRAKDWRFSFVPFIIGCVYLWMWHFQFKPTLPHVYVFILSLVTTAGFAGLGYFINEFFDIKDDSLAGKQNHLSLLHNGWLLVLFIAILAITFLPWVVLPHDKYSIVLMFIEVFLFVIYSVPPVRLKRIPVVSGFIDASYAYTIPLLLSYHTYCLVAAEQQGLAGYSPLNGFVVLAVLTWISGLRNILIHQVGDVFNDQRAGLYTLPMWAGVHKTNLMVVSFITIEIVLMNAFCLVGSIQHFELLYWLVFFNAIIAIRVLMLSSTVQFKYLCLNDELRHLTDLCHQYLFPVFTLVLLLISDSSWWPLLVFHFSLLVPLHFYRRFKYLFWIIQSKSVAIAYVFNHYIVIRLRLWFNYLIYFAFKACGVDLRIRNTSAWNYLKTKGKRHA